MAVFLKVNYAADPQGLKPRWDHQELGHKRLENYVQRESKVVHGGQRLVSFINCTAASYEDKFQTRKRWGRTEDIAQGRSRLFYHFVQSFKQGEISPAEAHELGWRFALELWGEGFEVTVATHVDTDSVHNHFVINNCSVFEGRALSYTKRDRELFVTKNDELCRAYGLSVPEVQKRSRIRHELAGPEAAIKQIQPERESLCQDIDLLKPEAANFAELLDLLHQQGYRIERRGQHLRYRSREAERWRRFSSLPEGYREEELRHYFLLLRADEELGLSDRTVAGAQRGEAPTEAGVLPRTQAWQIYDLLRDLQLETKPEEQLVVAYQTYHEASGWLGIQLRYRESPEEPGLLAAPKLWSLLRSRDPDGQKYYLRYRALKAEPQHMNLSTKPQERWKVRDFCRRWNEQAYWIQRKGLSTKDELLDFEKKLQKQLLAAYRRRKHLYYKARTEKSPEVAAQYRREILQLNEEIGNLRHDQLYSHSLIKDMEARMLWEHGIRRNYLDLIAKRLRAEEAQERAQRQRSRGAKGQRQEQSQKRRKGTDKSVPEAAETSRNKKQSDSQIEL